MIPNAPGVQMQPAPDDAIAEESDDEDDKPTSADQRISSKSMRNLLEILLCMELLYCKSSIKLPHSNTPPLY